jgi:hypothetical protein
MRHQSLGFRVYLGFRVKDLRFGLGFRVQGLRCRVWV